MRITGLTEAYNTELRKTDSSKRIEKNQKNSRSGISDRLDFSIDGKKLSETKADIEVASAQVSAMSDIRPEKIAEVKGKIEQGYYNTEEFVDKLADKLLSEFGIKKI